MNSPFLEDDTSSAYVCAINQRKTCTCNGVAVFGVKWMIIEEDRSESTLDDILDGKNGEYSARPL